MIIDKTAYGSVTFLDIIIAFGIIIFVMLIAKIINLSIRRSLREKVTKSNLNIVIKIFYTVVIVISLIFVLPLLGIKASGLLVAGGILGIVIGFASQSVVSNLISGFFLIIERPIKIGDQVSVAGVTGVVEDINIMSTTMRGYDGISVRMPNEKVFTDTINNLVANKARRFSYNVGIRYRDDADRALEIIKSIIGDNPYALQNPAPQIFVDELGNSSVNIVVRIWAPSIIWLDVKMALLWKIKKGLEAEGIEIPFPQRVLSFANELSVEKKGLSEISDIR